MTMKSNGLLKILVPLFVVVAMLVMVRACSSGGDTAQQEQEEDPTLQLTQDELRALGVEGDTPRDTVATLVGHVQQMRIELEHSQRETEELRREAARLSASEDEIEQRIEAAIQRDRQRNPPAEPQGSRADQSLLSSMQRELSNLRQRLDSDQNEELPIGLGLEEGRYPSGPSWVEPMDAQETGGRNRQQDEAIFPTSFDEVRHRGEPVVNEVIEQVTEPEEVPVYTVPQNSTLMGSLAMTALIGRVPVDGTVIDPFPFKVIVGPDNLTANGIEIPEVQSAIMSGTASGDWTLSCVRGDVHSVTFVFEDGTVRTLPEPEDVNSGGSGSRTKIGWLSDRMGVPCVSGERTSNAKQYLGTQALLTSAGAGVATLLSDDGDIATTFNSDGSVSTAMTGSQAAQQIMASGVNDMSRWVNRLYGEAFASIFVPPGQDVAIHIDRELQIDYETQGRRVHYDRDQSLGYGSMP
ncbi:TIGR03752 family integrating conjugative element protein [Vreelandella zhaodongensis]|uniref:TIGR03752 family integrating conjugative element protein n=1 Tax=Vreelandella zhaodongensis TaxID=1176240 RepID=UPI003EBD0521